MENTFDQLQTRLGSFWPLLRGKPQEHQTLIVLNSYSSYVPISSMVQKVYEERFLLFFQLLNQSMQRLIYITSQPIEPDLLEYYFDLGCTEKQKQKAKKKLYLLSVDDDDSSLSLGQKLLQRPDLIQKLQSWILDPEHTCMSPGHIDIAEQQLALALNIPIYGCHPEYTIWGNKSMSRRLFYELGENRPSSILDIYSQQDVIQAAHILSKKHPDMQKALLKWNKGHGGLGNVFLDLPLSSHHQKDVFDNCTLVSKKLDIESYFSTLSAVGGLVEEYITAPFVQNPSVQFQIGPHGEIAMLSMIQQKMGGIHLQKFLGCSFPIYLPYVEKLKKKAYAIAEALYKKKVIGFVSIDFIAVSSNYTDWQCYPLELNLRIGGAFAPILMLEYLTGGGYDIQKNRFITPLGHYKSFVSEDFVSYDCFKNLTFQHVISILQRADLLYHSKKQTGVVLYMFSAVENLGWFGLMSIGNTLEEAEHTQKSSIEIIQSQSNSR